MASVPDNITGYKPIAWYGGPGGTQSGGYNQNSYGWMTGGKNTGSDMAGPSDPSGSGNIWTTPGAFGNSLGNAINQGYYTDNPQAGYSAWLGYGGLGDNSDAAQYGRSQYSRMYNNYLSALPYMSPGAGGYGNSFLTYLNQSGYNPYNEFSSLGARARGDMPFMYAPRTRIVTPG